MKKGKQCPSCGAINIQDAYLCCNCDDNLADERTALYSDHQFHKDSALSKTMEDMPEVEANYAKAITSYVKVATNYGTASRVANGMELLGWLQVVIGVIVAIFLLLTGMGRYNFSLLGILPGIGIAMSGLFMVMIAQVTKATVDNANQTGELVMLVRHYLKKTENSDQ